MIRFGGRKRLGRKALLCGVVALLFYMTYSILGALLWPEYDPIIMDISSLGAVGAPNQTILRPILLAYDLSLFCCIIALLYRYHTVRYHPLIKAGAILLAIMAIVSKIGYTLFPLEGDKQVMTFANRMHIVTTVLVVFFSIGALFLFASGYMRSERHHRHGRILLVLASAFTLSGILNPLGIVLSLNILGITERITIYLLHMIIAYIGIYEYRQISIIDP